MTTTYSALAEIAQQAGVLFFMGTFLMLVAYALWPKNRGRFEEAARMPLRED